jgi:D-alanine-D-alanine ligase
LKDGTLLIAHLDVPMDTNAAAPAFRRDPEWLYGEGIGASRAPLVSMQFALRALKHARRLRKNPLGVLVYADEGRDCRYSSDIIAAAASQAQNVLVLRPGNLGDQVVTGRRGQRRYQLTVEGKPQRLGKTTAQSEVLRWLYGKLEACAKLGVRKDRTAVSAIEINSTHLPMLLPHRVAVTLLVSYPDEAIGDRIEVEIRALLKDKRIKNGLELISNRPPMKDRRANQRLLKQLSGIANEWEIPLTRESSVWPSVAGLASGSTRAACGIGPIARDLYTPDEAVQRTSLIQRTLLLSQFLNQQIS